MKGMTAILACGAFVWHATVAATQTVSVADPYKGDYSPRAKQLVMNEAKLNVVLKMDRAQYFTGESAELAIVVTNPTPSVLEIRDPSDHRGPVLDLMSKDPKWIPVYGSEWGFMGNPRAIYGPKHPDPPSVFVPAGHSLERRLRAHERLAGDHRPILPGGVPEVPGDYRLAYTYSQNSRAIVDFRVIQPRVVAHRTVVSPRTEPHVQLHDKRTVQLRRLTFVLGVEGDGAYWVVASLGTGPTYPRLVIDKDGRFAAGSSRVVGQFIRVARSIIPIVSLSGSLDAAENLTIVWTDLNRKTSTIELDPNRKPRGHTGPLP